MITRILAAIAAVFMLGACAKVSETILDLQEKATNVSEDVVRNSVEGARAYCGAVPDATRTRWRSLTNVAGKGPVIEIHCENL